MTVVTAWKRNDVMRKHKLIMMKMTYESGDTSVVADTGLSRVINYSVSPTSVTAKKVDYATEAAGVITITVADPLEDCYLFVTAEGI
jgi:hypothetical protein